MVARLVQQEESIFLLLKDGSICKRKYVALNTILKEFKHIDSFSEKDYELHVDYWNDNGNTMEEYSGKTIAYVNDDMELVIKDFAPFLCIFDPSAVWESIQNMASSEFMSLPEYAEYVNVNPARIKVLCKEHRFPGAVKIGRNWIFLLGKDTPYPEDQRMTNSKIL